MDLDRARALLAKSKQQQANQYGNRMEYWKVPNQPCKATVRFLPEINNEGLGKLVYTHFKVPHPEHGVIKCLRTWDMDCPYCQVIEEFQNVVDVEKYEYNTQSAHHILLEDFEIMDGTGMYVRQVVENPNSPRMLQQSGYSMYDWLIEQILSPAVGDITDIQNGVPVVITRTKKNQKVEKSVGRFSKPLADSPEAINKIINEMTPYSETLRVPDDEYMQRVQTCCVSLRTALQMKVQTEINSNSVAQQAKANPNLQQNNFNQQPANNYNQQPANNFNQQPANNFNQQANQVTPQANQVTPQANQVTPQANQVTPQANPVTPQANQVIPQANQVTPQANQVTPQSSVASDSVKKPLNAKQCFGDINTFNEMRDECIICEHMFECSQAVDKSIPFGG